MSLANNVLAAERLRSLLERIYRSEDLARPNHPYAPAGSRLLLFVRDIVSQFYCEKKVEWTLRILKTPKLSSSEELRGKAARAIRSECVQMGSQVLKKILALNRDSLHFSLSPTEFSISEARGRSVYVFTPRIAIELGDVLVLGAPPLVRIQRGEIKNIAAFRVRTSGDRRIFMGDIAQLQLYAYILASLGFRVSETVFSVFVLSQECLDCERLDNLLGNLSRLFRIRRDEVFAERPTPERKGESRELCTCEKGFFLRYSYRINPEDGRAVIDWAIPFWKGQREAIPTRYRRKCESCEFADICDAMPGLSDEERARKRENLRRLLRESEERRRRRGIYSRICSMRLIERIFELRDILRLAEALTLDDLSDLVSAPRKRVIRILPKVRAKIRIDGNVVRFGEADRNRLAVELVLRAVGVDDERVMDEIAALLGREGVRPEDVFEFVCRRGNVPDYSLEVRPIFPPPS